MTFTTHLIRDYIEIQTSHPYLARSKDTKELCEEFIDHDHDDDIYVKILFPTFKGDQRILNIQKKFLIAEHFVPNIDKSEFRQVLQLDGNKLNFDPDNLYWCTTNEMITRKVQKREYVDELPPDSIKINSVNNHTFSKYYYSPSTKTVYSITKSNRIQKIPQTKRGRGYIITIQDILGISRSITINRLLKTLGL